MLFLAHLKGTCQAGVDVMPSFQKCRVACEWWVVVVDRFGDVVVFVDDGVSVLVAPFVRRGFGESFMWAW